MTDSRPTAQTVLLAGLQPEETGLIRNLISAFELEALSVEIDTLNDPGTIFSEKEICLAVFHVDEQRKGQKLEIRRLAELLA